MNAPQAQPSASRIVVARSARRSAPPPRANVYALPAPPPQPQPSASRATGTGTGTGFGSRAARVFFALPPRVQYALAAVPVAAVAYAVSVLRFGEDATHRLLLMAAAVAVLGFIATLYRRPVVEAERRDMEAERFRYLMSQANDDRFRAVVRREYQAEAIRVARHMRHSRSRAEAERAIGAAFIDSI